MNNKPIIVVEVSGGCVQAVYSENVPADVKVIIVDHDFNEDVDDLPNAFAHDTEPVPSELRVSISQALDRES